MNSRFAQARRLTFGADAFVPDVCEVARVRLALAPALDDEHPVHARRVVGLVPLQLLVSHEAVLERPVGGGDRPVAGELVRPDERVRLTARGARLGARVRAGDRHDRDEARDARCAVRDATSRA